jgi:hypothetical protein
VADYDGGYDVKAGCSGVGHVVTTTSSDKHQAWSPIDHFERLIEEACPNHSYPIKHKLKDYDMMKKFRVLGYLTQGMELNEDPSGSDTMCFPKEDAVVMVYDGHPYQGGAMCLA